MLIPCDAPLAEVVSAHLEAGDFTNSSRATYRRALGQLARDLGPQRPADSLSADELAAWFVRVLPLHRRPLRRGRSGRLPAAAPLAAQRPSWRACPRDAVAPCGRHPHRPLRANNPDFSLVGPAWVAVVAFLALGLFHGMVVAALAGRYSRALPLVASRSRAIAAYAPLLLLILLFLVIPVIIAAGLVAGVVSQIRPVVALWHDRRVVTVGRVALAAVGLAALPGFVSALVDVLGPA